MSPIILMMRTSPTWCPVANSQARNTLRNPTCFTPRYIEKMSHLGSAKAQIGKTTLSNVRGLAGSRKRTIPPKMDTTRELIFTFRHCRLTAGRAIIAVAPLTPPIVRPTAATIFSLKVSRKGFQPLSFASIAGCPNGKPVSLPGSICSRAERLVDSSCQGNRSLGLPVAVEGAALASTCTCTSADASLQGSSSGRPPHAGSALAARRQASKMPDRRSMVSLRMQTVRDGSVHL
mmetsp:Transcript_105801/g.309484  ORF Transcript_105801/g.309484 Transcript_105801/m.309484 type:complete len:233 (+) Transcript_105801:526-1224(+)